MNVNSNITFEKVVQEIQKKEFLDFPARLYKDDRNYIRPLNKDIEDIFDVKKNNKM